MAGTQFTSQSAATPNSMEGLILNGGLNSTAGPLELKDNESSDLLNIDFNKFGSILKRSGYTYLNSTAINPSYSDGLHWFERDNAGSYEGKFVSVSSANVYSMTFAGASSNLTGGLTITPGNQVSFENWNNVVYMTNGVNVPFEWAGAGTAIPSAVPPNLTTAKYVSQFNNYLFYANVTVNSVVYSTRFYYSNISDPSTWGAADWIEVGFNDGQEITGMKVLGDRLVIYKTRSIYNVFFTGDASIPFVLPGGGKSNSNVGCISAGSIQEVENGHVFLALDGLYYYDGMNSTKLSHKITTTLDSYSISYFSKASSMVYKKKNRYYLSFTLNGETEASRIIVWDWFNNAFSIYKGWSPSSMETAFNDGIDEVPCFADYDGYVYKTDTGSSDYPLKTETAIDSYYYSNWRAFGDICDQKGVPNVYVYYQLTNAVLGFSYSYEFENTDQYTYTFSTATGVSVYGTAIYGVGTYSGSGGAIKRLDLTGRGRVVRFKFSNSTIGEGFQVDGFGALVHLETSV